MKDISQRGVSFIADKMLKQIINQVLLGYMFIHLYLLMSSNIHAVITERERHHSALSLSCTGGGRRDGGKVCPDKPLSPMLGSVRAAVA
jgi:hypothetical protein